MSNDFISEYKKYNINNPNRDAKVFEFKIRRYKIIYVEYFDEFISKVF